MSSILKNAKETAEGLMDNLRTGKDVHDHFIENFRRSYTIAGKTITQWEHEYRISVPADPDPSVCKVLDMKIMALHQEAAFYHAAASCYYQTLKKGNDIQYRARYTALVQEYKNLDKKLPARGTLEDLAKCETDDVESAVMNAQLQMEFWDSIMAHLNMCRRLLENATINSGIQVKMDGNHKGNIYG